MKTIGIAILLILLAIGAWGLAQQTSGNRSFSGSCMAGSNSGTMMGQGHGMMGGQGMNFYGR